MYDWLKKNQKKLLAVIGAFLMVSFLISVPLGSLTSGGHTKGLPIAHIGKTPVYTDQRKNAEAEWRMLGQYLRIETVENVLGPAITLQVQDHPELFMLLTMEAEQRGIDVSSDVVNTVIQNKMPPYLAFLATDSTWQHAIHDLLVVQMLRNQLVSNTKGSEPKWEHELAERNRTERLNLVEFSADQLSHTSTQPTTQQAETLFNAYKSVLPDSSTKPADDVLGFGYEIPNRVKLQYLTISRAEVLKAAEEAHRDAKDKPDQMPYDLQVKAMEYYLKNQSEFIRLAPETKPATEPATAPTTLATTQPSTQPTTPTTTASATTQPSPTTQPTTVATTEPVIPPGPTTRPIAEVQDEIITKLLKDETDELEKKIADSVHEKLTDGWQAWSRAHPTTQPAVATTWPAVTAPAAINASAEDPRHPATTQPSDYPTYAYLENVAQEIEREFKVLPEVTQVPEWSDAKTLEALPGIGSSKSDDQLFPLSVLNAAAFAVDAAHKSSGLQVWQPSATFADSKDNDYIYRLTDASPAHAPDLASIRPRVQEDARLKAAYDRANELAKKFVDEAKRTSFNHAALDDALPVISTGEFNIWQLRPDAGIPNFKASPQAIAALAVKTIELMSEATAENPNPIAIVPMPSEKMVIVAQLAGVALRVSPRDRVIDRLQFNKSGLLDSEKLAESYFNYDAVVKRLDYKPETPDKAGGS